LSGYFKKRGYEDSADIAANRIAGLPTSQPIKTFTFTAKELFDKKDTAKLKNQKVLKASGDFLAQNEFGFAVVVASSSMEGDSKADLVLSEARAMVIREYLVENFGFDDSQLKTMGMGKQNGANQSANLDANWGTIQILIFPAGSEIPADKPAALVNSAAIDSSPSAQVTSAVTRKP